MQSAISKAITSVRKSETGIEADFCFSETDPIFTGHFPGKPIIPAVYQVGLCRKVIEQNGNHVFMGIVKSRFSKMCVPGNTYRLKVTPVKSDAGSEMSCSIYGHDGKELCSKIVLLIK